MTPGVSTNTPARATIALLAALLVGLVASACVSPATPSPQATPGPSAPAASPSGGTPSSEPYSAPPTAPLGPCEAGSLAARVTAWDGAAGHRIASVELQNTGSGPCALFSRSRPQLVDGKGSILIEGAPPAASSALIIAPGDVLRTVVQDGNYCGPEPAPPVTVAFVLPDGLGTVVASPVSPGDTSGLPPCMGAAGSPGDVEMQPWSP